MVHFRSGLFWLISGGCGSACHWNSTPRDPRPRATGQLGSVLILDNVYCLKTTAKQRVTTVLKAIADSTLSRLCKLSER